MFTDIGKKRQGLYRQKYNCPSWLVHGNAKIFREERNIYALGDTQSEDIKDHNKKCNNKINACDESYQ